MSSPRPPRTKRKRVWTFKRIVLLFFAIVIAIPFIAWIIPATRWAYASGYVMTDQEAEIRSSVEGAIEKWLIDDGKIVKQGQILIQLKNSVQTAAYQQTCEELKSLKAELEHLKSKHVMDESQRKQQIFQAKRKLEVARDKLHKMEKTASGVFSQQEIIEAKLGVDVAESKLQELSLSYEEIIAKRTEVLQEKILAAEKKCALHQAELEMRQICSPLNGTVFLNRFEPGEVVKPEHVLGQVFDTNRWIVKLKLPEKHIRYVEQDQSVKISLAAYPKLRFGYIYAKVIRIIPVVTPQATGNGIFYVEAQINDPEKLRLTPGMVASAKINTGRSNWLMRIIGW